MTSVVAGKTVDAPPPAPHRAPDDHSGGDLCVARPGSVSERVGSGLASVPPLAAGAVVTVGLGLVTAAAIVGLGFLLVDVVLPGAIQRWDMSVVRDLASGRPGLDDVSLVASYLAEPVTVFIVIGIIIAVCVWQRWFSLTALFAIAIALEGIFYLVATYFVERSRPRIERLDVLIHDDSYYSGHVAAAVVIWVVLALIVWNQTTNRMARTIVVLLAIVAPVLVALARIYRGMHNPTDSMVGYVVGFVCVGIALFAVRVANATAAARRAPRHEEMS